MPNTISKAAISKAAISKARSHSWMLFSAVLLGGSLVGCAGEVVAFTDLLEGSIYEDDEWGYQSNWDVKPVSLDGDIGGAQGLSEEGVVGEAWQDRDYASVEIHSERDFPAAMVWVSVSGNMETLAVGDVVITQDPDAIEEGELDSGLEESLESGALYVEVVGCSGDSSYDWDYDETASDVVLEVVGEDEDSLEIEVTGSLPADEGAEATLIRSRFSVPK